MVKEYIEELKQALERRFRIDIDDESGAYTRGGAWFSMSNVADVIDDVYNAYDWGDDEGE